MRTRWTSWKKHSHPMEPSPLFSKEQVGLAPGLFPCATWGPIIGTPPTVRSQLDLGSCRAAVVQTAPRPKISSKQRTCKAFRLSYMPVRLSCKRRVSSTRMWTMELSGRGVIRSGLRLGIYGRRGFRWLHVLRQLELQYLFCGLCNGLG